MSNSLFEHSPFKLYLMQVYNWGTFQNLHDIPISIRGHLIVGASGSGKSTLLDVFTVLLGPSGRKKYNVAARVGEKGKKQDRNLLTYIRGAWGSTEDEFSSEISKKYLRKKATLSAVSLAFKNNMGKTVTLLGLFWISGSSQSVNDVKSLYVAIEDEFSISNLQSIKPDMRNFKKYLADHHPTDTYNEYRVRSKRLLGIPSDNALKLLQQAQAAEKLDDLTDFLRNNMLGIPKTFEIKDSLVQGFANLKSSHEAVLRVKHQITTLLPARDKYENILTNNSEINKIQSIQSGMDFFFSKEELRLLNKEEGILSDNINKCINEIEELDKKIQSEHDNIKTCNDLLNKNGGNRLEELKQRVGILDQSYTEKNAARIILENHCKTLDKIIPENRLEFDKLAQTSKELLSDLKGRQSKEGQKVGVLNMQIEELQKELQIVRDDIQVCMAQKSAIPRYLLEIRSNIAKAVGCHSKELPFAGELMQVLTTEQRWRPSIEKVLRPLALSMLVDDNTYDQVRKYVNSHNLGNKLDFNYTKILQNQSNSNSTNPAPLYNKLEFKTHSQTNWLKLEIQKRFDYVCVDDVQEIKRFARAITVEGLIRRSISSHTKDDRPESNDSKRWVLSFDISEKINQYHTQLKEIENQILEKQSLIDKLVDTDNFISLKISAADNISNTLWDSINVNDLLIQLNMTKKNIEEIKRDPKIKQINDDINNSEKEKNQLEGKKANVLADKKNYTKDMEGIQKRIDIVSDLISTMNEIDPDSLSHLSVWLKKQDDFQSSKDVVKAQSILKEELKDSLHGLQTENMKLNNDIVNIFKFCLDKWAAETGSFEASVKGAVDFMQWLKELEEDKLANYEENFFELLQEQGVQRLSALSRSLLNERKEINNRLDNVNIGLNGKEFNQGTVLTIEVRDIKFSDLDELRKQIKEISSGGFGFNAQNLDEREEAEKRFIKLDKLVERFKSERPDDTRWAKRVLDVREQVEFIAYEIDKNGTKVDVYNSGSGKSGGQRQKLTAACLAAALRYQLCEEYDEEPAYTTIVLDEAFSNADHDYTRQAMDIFVNFGFQMIVATPMKSVRTLEPFIGGASIVSIRDRKQSTTHLIEYNDEVKGLMVAGIKL